MDEFDPFKAGATEVEDFDPFAAGAILLDGQQQDEAVKDRERYAQGAAALATQLFQGNLANPAMLDSLAVPRGEMPDLSGAWKPDDQSQDPDVLAQQAHLNRAVGVGEAKHETPFFSPLVSPSDLDYLTQFGPMNSLAKILPEPAAEVVRGVRSGVNEFVSSNMSPENLALLAAVPAAPELAQPLISGYFAKQMGEGTANEISQAMGATTPEERTKHIVSAVLSGAMTATAGLHALSAIHSLAKAPETPPPLPPLQAKSAEVLTGINPNDAPVSPELAKTNEVLDKMAAGGSQVPGNEPAPETKLTAIAPDGSKVEIQPTREGAHVITTAVEGTDGKLYIGEKPTAPHFDPGEGSDPKTAVMWQHLDPESDDLHPTIGGQSKFIVQDAEGTIKVADRSEAQKIAEEAVPPQRRQETFRTDLKSQDLIPEQLPEQPKAETPTEEPAAPPPEPPQTPPEAAPPPPLPEGPTGIRNTQVDADRVRLGMPPAMQAAAEAHGQWWNHALSILDGRSSYETEGGQILKGPNASAELERSLAEKPRALDPVETALLTHRKITLETDWADQVKRGDDAVTAANPEAVQSARIGAAHALDQLNQLFDVTKIVGTKSGQSLAARKLLVNRDFTVLTATQEARMFKGEDLTDTEEAQVAERVKNAKDTQAKADELAATEEQRSLEESAQKKVDEDVKKLPKVRPPKSAKLPAITEKVVSFFDQKAAEARKRQGGRLFSGLDPTQLADAAIIGASHIVHGAAKLGEWSAKMLSEFGEKIRPHLEKIFENSKALVRSKSSVEGTMDSIKQGLSEEMGKEELYPLIKRLAEQQVEMGARGWKEVIRATHEEVQKAIPDITQRDVLDAYTENYKERPKLSKDPMVIAKAQAQAEAKKAVHLSNAVEGKIGEPFGVKRQPPTAENRRLTKLVTDTIKSRGLKVTDPATQLKTTLDGIKTRLKNEIEDLGRAISEKRALPKREGAPAYDTEANDLLARRNALKAHYNEVFGKEGLSDEARLKNALAAAERSEKAANERLADARKGVFPGTKTRKVWSNAEIDAVRARRDAANAETKHLRNMDSALQEQKKGANLDKRIANAEERLKNAVPEKQTGKLGPETESVAAKQARLQELQKQQAERVKAARAMTPEERTARDENTKQRALQKKIDDLKADIASGKVGPKEPTTRFGPDTAESDRLKTELADLRKQKEALRESTGVNAKLALDAYKSRAANREAMYADKLARKDFGPRAKTAVKLDSEAVKAQAAANQAMTEFRRGQRQFLENQKPRWQKGVERLARLKRAAVLSWPTIFGKLASAAQLSNVAALAEEGTAANASGVLKLIGAGAIPRAAPRYGHFSAHAIVEAEISTVKNLFKDFSDKIKTGTTDYEKIYGKPDLGAPHWEDVVGRFHAALKASAERNEFMLSFEKRMKYAADHDVDITNPEVKMRIGQQALADAMDRVFLGRNLVAEMIQSAKRGAGMATKDIRSLAADSEADAVARQSPGGVIAKAALSAELPIVKVPANIVARTFEYALGLPVGTLRVANFAARRGIAKILGKAVEELPPDIADSIVRNLARGQIGAALIAIGYGSAKAFGGLYQPGEKRSSDDLKYGQTRIFGIPIPAVLLHHPAMAMLQVGSTIRRVADYAAKGIPAGVTAAALGVIRDAPGIQQMKDSVKALDPRSLNQFLTQQARTSVPGFIQWLAQRTDIQPGTGNFITGEPVSRSPKNPTEGVMTSIPGARQTVPTKKGAPLPAFLRRK